MKASLYPIAALAPTVFLLVRAGLLGRRRQIYIFKPLATLLVISVVLLSFLEPSWNSFYTFGVLAGLLLSFAGDIALMFPENPKAFAAGLRFFLLAHIA